PNLFFASFVLADPLAYPLLLTTLYVGVCVLARPTRSGQLGFLVLTGLTALTRIQYALLPVVFVAGAIAVERGSVRRMLGAFGLYRRRGRPARLATCLLAVVLLAVSARVPLAPYSVANNKQDSPFLLGAFRLEHSLGVANGSLVIALVAALLSGLAVAIAWRAQLAVLALLGSLVLAGAASAGSISVDRNPANEVRHDFLPANAGWIDQIGLRHILLIHTPATLHARSP